MELPVKATRATKMLGFDADGDPVMSGSTMTEIDASVATITSIGAGGAVTDAGNVTYDQGGTGSTITTVEAKLQESVSVKDFGAVGDGVTDDTAAIQAAIDSLDLATGTGDNIIHIPSGNYLVTDTLTIGVYTAIRGAGGYSAALNSKITFSPTTAKSLFVAGGPLGTVGTFRQGISVTGLYILGNSTTSTGNSLFAFDLETVIHGNFSDLEIRGFRTGIKLGTSIMNRFNRVNIADCYEQCVSYVGNQATSDVWSECSFVRAPIGVNATGANLMQRFNDCIFENLELYGVNLSRECYLWQFVSTYCENIPSLNPITARPDQSGAMFRLGHTGSVSGTATIATITGGRFQGQNNASPSVGTFLDIDNTMGVIVTGVFASAWSTIISTTEETKDNAFFNTGMQVNQYLTFNQTTVTAGAFVSGVVYKILTAGTTDYTLIGSADNNVGTTFTSTGVGSGTGTATTTTGSGEKMEGCYPNATLNNAAYGQLARFTSVFTPIVNGGGGSLTLTGGAASTMYCGTTTSIADFRPGSDNLKNFGAAGGRWKEIFAGNGTINTSDEREKQQIELLTVKEKAVAVKLKAAIRTFRFNDSVAEKGTDARIHVGVIAQNVEAIFISEGLDAFNYSVLCYDEWDEVLDEQTGEVITKAGNLYGVRYNELLCFIISAI
jgi:hypothetical protein